MPIPVVVVPASKYNTQHVVIVDPVTNVPVTSDAQVAALVADPASGTTAAVSAKYAPRALPAHAGARGKVFDPGLSVYNRAANSMRKVRNALGKGRSGVCRITFVGDSVTAGQGATIGTQDPATRLRERFQALGYQVGELVWGFNSTTADSRINRGSWASGNATVPYMTTSTVDIPLTYTSALAGTVVEIVSAGSSGAFTYAIDGGSAVTVWAGPGYGNTLTVVTGLANTTHTVVIKATTTSTVYIAALGVRQTTGVVLSNGGQSGAVTANWLGTAFYEASQTAAGTQPDIVFVELGLNDFATSVSAATFESNLGSIVDRWKNTVGVPVILVVSHVLDAVFASSVYDVADLYDLPLLDLRDRIGATSTETNLITGDGVHFTAQGYEVKAKAWADALEL